MAQPGNAEAPKLGFPLDCALGSTCFIQQYVDHDPGPGASDFACGPLSYDGHKGTDFALPTHQAMRDGVAVFAMARGRVAGTRNTMADTGYSDQTAAQIIGRECGNGLVLRHPDGWETQYCHLRQGSVTVLSGQMVDKGQILGWVGLSGRTEFPHLHVSVRKDGAVVDPFDTDGARTGGAPGGPSLFETTPPYQPGGVLDAGFSSKVPDYARVKDGTATEALTSQSPALVFFALLFGGQKGDRFEIRIDGPDGPVMRSEDQLTRTQAQLFRAAGRRRPAQGWTPGDYLGAFRLIRNGEEIGAVRRRITLTSR